MRCHRPVRHFFFFFFFFKLLQTEKQFVFSAETDVIIWSIENKSFPLRAAVFHPSLVAHVCTDSRSTLHGSTCTVSNMASNEVSRHANGIRQEKRKKEKRKGEEMSYYNARFRLRVTLHIAVASLCSTTPCVLLHLHVAAVYRWKRDLTGVRGQRRRFTSFIKWNHFFFWRTAGNPAV